LPSSFTTVKLAEIHHECHCMSLTAFLHSLETGRVTVDDPRTPVADDAEAVDLAIRECDQVARTEMAGNAPLLVPGAARWAAELLYKGCQLTVHRDADAQQVATAMRTRCPHPPAADVLYSVDLTLRCLVDLLVLARGVSHDDVLVAQFRRLAFEWPLSSVGAEDLGDGQFDTAHLEIIAGHASLRQLYVDRIIALRDPSRLNHPGVREGVREAIGAFDELCPAELAVMRRLERETWSAEQSPK
jgi:hypothetical protein